MKNEMSLEFLAYSGNESFARMTVGAFFVQLNPTLEELADVKTAVSEAVTNAIVHGYGERGGTVRIQCAISSGEMEVVVEDHGVGIEDVKTAMQPFFTTSPGEERSGMGFTVMESFMDSLRVISKKGEGTKVIMVKKVAAAASPIADGLKQEHAAG